MKWTAAYSGSLTRAFFAAYQSDVQVMNIGITWQSFHSFVGGTATAARACIKQVVRIMRTVHGAVMEIDDSILEKKVVGLRALLATLVEVEDKRFVLQLRREDCMILHQVPAP